MPKTQINFGCCDENRTEPLGDTICVGLFRFNTNYNQILNT